MKNLTFETFFIQMLHHKKQEEQCRYFHHPANGDDRLNFYIESLSGFYYYFSYKKGILSVNSNNPEMKSAFEKLQKSNKIKTTDKGKDYEIQWTTGEIVYHFKAKMQ